MRSSSALPLPRKNRGSGRSRLPVTVATGRAPADSASCVSSSRSSGSTCAPIPKRTRTARGVRVSLRCGLRRGRVLFGRQAYVARRHDGRDRVLVDHLAHAVLEQDHELIERVDLALQLDAVDEINRYRYALLAQGIQEGVLQRLAFGHRFLLVLVNCNF